MSDKATTRTDWNRGDPLPDLPESAYPSDARPIPVKPSHTIYSTVSVPCPGAGEPYGDGRCPVCRTIPGIGVGRTIGRHNRIVHDPGGCYPPHRGSQEAGS